MSKSPKPNDMNARPSYKMVLGLIVFIAVTSAACAAALNHIQSAPDEGKTALEASAQPGASSASSPEDESEPDPQLMVTRLEARLKQSPQDVNGWRMLARAYTVMERPQDAVAANRRVVALAPDDADAMVELGRAIGYLNNRQLNAEAEALMNKALKKDPGNVLAHALLGKTEMERGQASKAKAHWQDALAHLDAQHPFADQLRKAIQAADQVQAAPTTPAPSSKPQSQHP